MARASREEKAASRTRIVASAARLFRERGIEATGVGDIMQAAGLTHGGFYRHFASKEDLAREAIDWMVTGLMSNLEVSIATKGAREGVTEYIDQYLSLSHVSSPGKGCPIAALSDDAARGSKEIAASIDRGIAHVTRLLAGAFVGARAKREATATALFALLVGSVVLARAAPDEEARKRILRAAKAAAAQHLHHG